MASLKDAFLAACEGGDAGLVNSLSFKVNINEKNENGYSGLALAVRNGHLDIVEALIDEEADINSVNEAGQSVLFLAAWHNRVEIVKSLIVAGALINIPDNRGWTPLIIAVYHNYQEIIQILLESGADPSHKDCFGKTAAERAKNSEIVALLQRYENSPADKRLTPNTLGRIMNSSISSIQSDNRPGGIRLVPAKQSSKLQLELENHVKTQTKAIEKELSVDWSDLLEHCLNEEIFQAETILIEEVESFVSKNLNENYSKLRENCFSAVEEKYRNIGYKISPSKIPYDGVPRIGLTKGGRGRRIIEKLRVEADDAYFDTSSTEPNDLRLEVVKYIEKSIESLAAKFERVSQDVIIEEISARILKIKNMVAAEVQEFVVEAGEIMRKNLEKVAEEREKEIISGNAGKVEESYKAKDRPSGGGKLKESLSATYAVPDRSYKPKYEENYEFIESLANNYTGYKASTSENPSLSGSFTKDSKYVPKKPPKKEERMPIPRTDAASVLQQFLKK